ncbi:hypothetical protein NIIDMKKI_10710 [Mycobacterium kansasii]|uniref:PE domain-containing protein n=1 Tax=Mycobacterium kansasii TaxID=1768 RepID=A0A7G1I7S9_MYCKA|nr:hypothetical protein NIIDMKKI_10710 [Mycobacterium kansasii]
MSFVVAVPEFLAVAASDLADIASAVVAANTAAAAPTAGVLAAGADEVSAAIAAVFAEHATGYQTLSAQAAEFHRQFVQLLDASAGHYALAEAANASPLQLLEQQFLDVINAPTTLLLGRALIGNGANGEPGADGQPGGLLIGNGGAGGSGTAAHPAGGNGGAGGMFGSGGAGGTGRPAAPVATVEPVDCSVTAEPAGTEASLAVQAAPAGPPGSFSVPAVLVAPARQRHSAATAGRAAPAAPAD